MIGPTKPVIWFPSLLVRFQLFPHAELKRSVSWLELFLVPRLELRSVGNPGLEVLGVKPLTVIEPDWARSQAEVIDEPTSMVVFCGTPAPLL